MKSKANCRKIYIFRRQVDRDNPLTIIIKEKQQQQNTKKKLNNISASHLERDCFIRRSDQPLDVFFQESHSSKLSCAIWMVGYIYAIGPAILFHRGIHLERFYADLCQVALGMNDEIKRFFDRSPIIRTRRI